MICDSRKGILMTKNTILNTDMFTKIVIKNEDDDTVVAVITAEVAGRGF